MFMMSPRRYPWPDAFLYALVSALRSPLCRSSASLATFSSFLRTAFSVSVESRRQLLRLRAPVLAAATLSSALGSGAALAWNLYDNVFAPVVKIALMPVEIVAKKVVFPVVEDVVAPVLHFTVDGVGWTLEETGNLIDGTVPEANKAAKKLETAICNLSGADSCSFSGGGGFSSRDGFFPTDGQGNRVSQPRPQPVAPRPEVALLSDEFGPIPKMLTFIDPDSGDVVFGTLVTGGVGQSESLRALPKNLFCRGNSCIDRGPAYVETTIDLLSLSVGINEWRKLDSEAPFTDYVVVGSGIAADLGAVVIPGVPGVASLLIKDWEPATRGAFLSIVYERLPRSFRDKIPKGWRVTQPRKGAGIKFVSPEDSGTWIRIKGTAPHSTVRIQKDGRALNKTGAEVPTQSTESHMTRKEFEDHFSLEFFSKDKLNSP